MCWVTLQYCWEVLQAVGVLAGSTGRLLPARGSSEVRLDASFVCFPQRGRVYSLLAILTWRRSWCWCPLSPLYCGRLVCVSGERQSSQLSVTVQGRFRFLIRMGAKNYWEPGKQVFLENMCIRSPDRSPWCFTAVVPCDLFTCTGECPGRACGEYFMCRVQSDPFHFCQVIWIYLPSFNFRAKCSNWCCLVPVLDLG